MIYRPLQVPHIKYTQNEKLSFVSELYNISTCFKQPSSIQHLRNIQKPFQPFGLDLLSSLYFNQNFI